MTGCGSRSFVIGSNVKDKVKIPQQNEHSAAAAVAIRDHTKKSISKTKAPREVEFLDAF